VKMLVTLRFAALVLLLTVAVAACGGGDDSEPDGTPESTGTAVDQSASVASSTGTAGPTPGEAPSQDVAGEPTALDEPAATDVPESDPPGGERLTPEQLQEFRPNELGWIPVLQYHHFGPVPDQLTRTPEQFRGDLQWLYDNGFYVVNVRDYINNRMPVPAGKRPVMLTFDDSAVSQFNIQQLPDGQLTVDPNSAIAILEAFFNEHPDFGRGGHFAILPDRAFSWPDAWDQQEFSGMKLEWLVNNGYELGNHTIDHANLALIETPEIQYQLAEAERLTRKFIPDARLEIVTLPYGGYPDGNDDTVFSGFHYEGEYFEYEAVLLVGANPAYSTVSTEYHPFWIPRIQAFDEELGRWQDFILENPGIMYVSDGSPDTVTIPNEIDWALQGTLDESKLMGRELIRY
jgi:peptidoglycan/xylan/chitin deacetylase (PgdA/CDA1 family)